MAFSRKFLLDNGVPEDKIDAILAERNRTLSDYIPKADVQAQIDEALKNAKPQEVDVKTTPEYLALAGENAKLKAFQGDDFSSVKAPYRDIVWEKLDHAEKHTPYTEQIAELAKTMPDLFVTPTEEPQKPSFGAAPQGAAPTGQKGESFGDIWGFGKK